MKNLSVLAITLILVACTEADDPVMMSASAAQPAFVDYGNGNIHDVVIQDVGVMSQKEQERFKALYESGQTRYEVSIFEPDSSVERRAMCTPWIPSTDGSGLCWAFCLSEGEFIVMAISGHVVGCE